MPVKVRIPTPLRRWTDGRAEIEIEAGTVADLLAGMEEKYEGLGEKLIDETGEVRQYINLYVNDEDIRFLSGMRTALGEGDVVSIVPAVAGGR